MRDITSCQNAESMLSGSGTFHNSRISFSINDFEYEGKGRIIDSTKESQLASQVSEIMNAKYRWDQGLIVELRPLNLI